MATPTETPTGVHINRVKLCTNEYLNRDGTIRRTDEIEVHMVDMWFRKEVKCRRDEMLAQRLADEAGVPLERSQDAPVPLSPEEQEEFVRSFDAFAD